jgi:hypothetical protein
MNSPGYPHRVKLCFVNPILSWCNCHKGNSCHSKGINPVNSPGYPHRVKLCFVNPILSWCNCHKGNSCHSKGVSPVNNPGYPHTVKLCFVNPILSSCNCHKGNRHRQTDGRTKWINIYDMYIGSTSKYSNIYT